MSWNYGELGKRICQESTKYLPSAKLHQCQLQFSIGCGKSLSTVKIVQLYPLQHTKLQTYIYTWEPTYMHVIIILQFACPAQKGSSCLSLYLIGTRASAARPKDPGFLLRCFPGPVLQHVGAETAEAQPDQEQVLVLHNQVIRVGYVSWPHGLETYIIKQILS